jgi:hypothetical protein
MRLSERASKTADLKNANASLTIKREGSQVVFLLTGWDKKLGKIVASKPSKGYSGAWIVSDSSAVGGFGPLIYDAAIEWCTINGGGLTADRTSVSPAARKVWSYYMNSRSDVQNHQLDDDKNTLTPTNDDNAGMHAATVEDDDDSFASFNAGSADWRKSPLSKRFTKEPEILKQLKSMGVLKESRRITLREAIDPNNDYELVVYGRQYKRPV